MQVIHDKQWNSVRAFQDGLCSYVFITAGEPLEKAKQRAITKLEEQLEHLKQKNHRQKKISRAKNR